MVLGFKEYQAQGLHLAQQLGCSYQQVKVHYFPDSECKVTLPAGLPEHVILCLSLDRPNNKLIELLFAAKTARRLGAQRLTLVAPYLCYMRQDKAFEAGEAVSQSIIGQMLADLFDDVITVDPHLHRTLYLEDAIPVSHTVTLSASEMMREFLCQDEKFNNNTLLLGPDAESEQWVSRIADGCGLDYAVARKKRLGDRELSIELPELEFSDKHIVVVDDVISSGETVAIAAKGCFERGAKQVNVLVTHALFAHNAIERLQQVGINGIWSTDSIPHPTNQISLAGLLAAAVQEIA